VQGRVDAACMIDGNHLVFGREGTLPPESTRVLSVTDAYDHYNFTLLDGAPEDLVERFRTLLLAMRYDDPQVRPLLDLEGLKVWKEGRTQGYALLEEAVDRFGSIDGFVSALAERHG
jgi:ABC-type phosphate/phosphonate transport system substrate-binding protein